MNMTEEGKKRVKMESKQKERKEMREEVKKERKMKWDYWHRTARHVFQDGHYVKKITVRGLTTCIMRKGGRARGSRDFSDKESEKPWHPKEKFFYKFVSPILWGVLDAQLVVKRYMGQNNELSTPHARLNLENIVLSDPSVTKRHKERCVLAEQKVRERERERMRDKKIRVQSKEKKVKEKYQDRWRGVEKA